MAHNSNHGITRSARALTLQSGALSKDLRDAATDRHSHFRTHRHHRSLQVSSKDVQSAVQPSGPQLADLLSPARATGAAGPGLGSKDASLSPTGSKAASREHSREREKREAKVETMTTVWTWNDVKRERARNHQREGMLSTTYSRVATAVRRQTNALNSLQSSLETTLASASKLASQLRDLYQSCSRSLETLNESSIPNLVQTSETHLAALQRAHVSNTISQLATLKSRIATAREKTIALQHRVETCAQRAAVEEERERAELRAHKRRIGFIWSFLCLVMILWVTGVLWRGGSTEWRRDNEIDFEALHRGNVELHDTLRSKGVEWALGDEPLPGTAHDRGPKSWVSTTNLPQERMAADIGLGERLERAFDDL